MCSLFFGARCGDPADECKYKTREEVKLPDQVLDMFYFKKGCYWILKNELTSETDSIWVRKEPILEILSSNIGSGVYCIGASSISTGYNYLDSAKVKTFSFNMQKNPSLAVAPGQMQIENCVSYIQYDITKEVFFFQLESNCVLGDRKPPYGTLLKDLTINQINYNRVLRIANFGYKYDTLFWAEKVGCVQAYKNGIRYSLIRKNIN